MNSKENRNERRELPVFTSDNMVRMTGMIGEISHEIIHGHLLAHVGLVTATRFLTLGGVVREEVTCHNVAIWQRHVSKPVESIEVGNIVRIEGELKNQAWQTRANGQWYKTPTVFCYDFEILAKEGTLDVQPTRAKTYDEELRLND